MRKLRLVWAVVLGFCTACADPLPPSVSETSGYPVSLSYAAAPVLLRAAQPTEDALRRYMEQKVPNWGARPQSAALLAGAIRTLAEDFAVDARLLAAMIAQESAFDARAVSPTGAVGLTQLTLVGIHEFLDQSGVVYEHLGNRVYAGTGTEFFQDAIQKHWTQFPVGKELEDFNARNAWAKSCKERIFAQPDQYGAQIIAGATVLKAAIAYACSQSPRCSPANIGGAEWVRAGLERYNGDNTLRADGEVTKVHYARQIMQALDAMRF